MVFLKIAKFRKSLWQITPMFFIGILGLILMAFSYMDVNLTLRQVASFALFILPVVVSSIRTRIEYIWNILDGFRLYTFLAVVYKIGELLQSGITDPATLKAIIGSQRVGFFYVFVLWYTLYRSKGRKSIFLLLEILIIVAGVFLTFSRASYVALIFTILIHFLFQVRSQPNVFRKLRSILIFGVTIVGSFTILAMLIPSLWEFIDARLISLFLEEGNMSKKLGNSSTSEGTRIMIWKNAMSYVLYHPFFGSGWLGVFVLDHGGSAHNEFVDRLFKAGVLNFLLYVSFMIEIGMRLVKNNYLLFIGFSSLFVYGMFHETFSQSLGINVLVMCLLIINSSEVKNENINI